MDLEDKKEDKSIKGEDMSDEFLELDSLNEQDLIEALGGASIQSSCTKCRRGENRAQRDAKL